MKQTSSSFCTSASNSSVCGESTCNSCSSELSSLDASTKLSFCSPERTKLAYVNCYMKWDSSTTIYQGKPIIFFFPKIFKLQSSQKHMLLNWLSWVVLNDKVLKLLLKHKATIVKIQTNTIVRFKYHH